LEKKGYIIGSIIFILSISAINCQSLIINNTPYGNSDDFSGIIFYDDFNDNQKDFEKWTEIYTNGTWEEINQRTEFNISENNDEGARYQGIESIAFNVDISKTKSIIIDAEIFSDILHQGWQWIGRVNLKIYDGENLDGYEGYRKTLISFYGSAVGGEPPYTFEWNFGGTSQNVKEQNPTHKFTEEGTYTVTLTVTDSSGNFAYDTSEVTVLEPKTLEAQINGPSTTLQPGVQISFSATATGGLKPYDFVWDFGDGSDTVEGQNAVHSYSKEGTYTITLTVTDKEDTTISRNIDVTIADEDNIKEAEIKDIKCSFGSVKATIKTGDQPVDWSIDVGGGFILLGGYDSGSLPEKSVMTVQTPFTFGFGNVEITVTANDLVEKRSAYLVGPFFILVKEI
jgi:PKD repeat protein